MKHLTNKKIYIIFVSLLTVLLLTNQFALAKNKKKPKLKNTTQTEVTTETIEQTANGTNKDETAPITPNATAPKPPALRPLTPFTVPTNKGSSEPLWVDTENPPNEKGIKVYLDMNSQYFFDLGHIYTVKYVEPRTGNTSYVQVKLKLKGKQAAIIDNPTTEYKKTYEVPFNLEYKDLTPDKAIYNSSRMVIENHHKPVCPKNICKYK